MEIEQKGGPSVNTTKKETQKNPHILTFFDFQVYCLLQSSPTARPHHQDACKIPGLSVSLWLPLVSTAGSSLEHQHNNGLTFRFSVKANVNLITKEDIWYPVSGSRILLHNEFNSPTVIRTWHLERQRSALRQGCLSAPHSAKTC